MLIFLSLCRCFALIIFVYWLLHSSLPVNNVRFIRQALVSSCLFGIILMLDVGGSSGFTMFYPAAVLFMFFTLIEFKDRKRIRDELITKDTFLKTILNTMPDVLFVIDNQGNYLNVLSSKQNIYHLNLNGYIGKNLTEIWPDDMCQRFIHIVQTTLVEKQPQSMLYQRMTRRGLRWFEGETQPFPNDLFGGSAVVFIARDIHERHISELAKHETEIQLNSIYELGSVGFAFSNQSRLIRVNRYLCELLEYTEDELLQCSWHDPIYHEDYKYIAEARERMEKLQCDNQIMELRYLTKLGRLIPARVVAQCTRNEDQSIRFITFLVEDISEQKKKEAEIRHLAFYDFLTGLPNRRFFIEQLQLAMNQTVYRKCFGALFFIDLDNFKVLNDTLGHEKGDLLLQEVANRLRRTVDESELVARQSGDEFVILLPSLGHQLWAAQQQCQRCAEKLLHNLAQPYDLGRVIHTTTASVGITLFSNTSVGVDELYKRADIAMYQAKESGGNNYCFFNEETERRVAYRAALNSEMREALLMQQFSLFYQIQVNYAGKAIGCEALIRWFHPERGTIVPDEFIPIAEESKIIVAIGDWVLETACRQLVIWAEQPEFAALTVSVNVSARQFFQDDYVERVKHIIQQTKANPRCLKLEITESLLLQDIENVVQKMLALKQFGVGFSLDDFGTGYSSLTYLKRLPLDQLKIDRSFVQDLDTSTNDGEIARMIAGLADNMRIQVLAEGVETEAQCHLLASYGCFAYQGYYFGKPVPPEMLSLHVGGLSRH